MTSPPTFPFGRARLELVLLHFHRDLVVLHATEEGAAGSGAQPGGAGWKVSRHLQPGWRGTTKTRVRRARSQSPEPEPGTRAQNQSPEPEPRARAQSQSPEPRTRARSQSPEPEPGVHPVTLQSAVPEQLTLSVYEALARVQVRGGELLLDLPHVFRMDVIKQTLANQLRLEGATTTL